MQEHIDTVVQYLFREEGLRNVPVARLRQFVTEHPYSAAGRYLLIRKLKDEAPEEYETEMETSVLYYNNPLWLQFLLDNPGAPGLITHAPSPEWESPEAAAAEMPDPPDQPSEGTGAGLSTESADLPETEPVEKAFEPIEESTLASSGEESVPPARPEITLSAAGEPIAFEPFHTIDYFASQGIKLSREELDKDQLGRQLKSFTDWLRSMKRISPQTELVENPSGEQAVQAMAGLSVEGNEAETEAMAEVWRKQGNRAKAIAIYEKLSLRNPSKSHYFAAKIEELKA